MLAVFREGPEKAIDRHERPRSRFLTRDQLQLSPGQHNFGVRRHHVNVVRFHQRLALHSLDGNRRDSGQQRGEQTFVFRIQMLDHDQGEACIRGEMFEESRTGFQSSGGGSDAHDRKLGRAERHFGRRRGAVLKLFYHRIN
jgi:hypothetical protein